MRDARTKGPQAVSVHGRDAVVVLSVEDYARLIPTPALPSLHALLSESPLRDLDFGEDGVRMPAREITL